METNKMSFNGWMDKENEVCTYIYMHTYNGLLFSLKKERSTGICDNMDEPKRHYAKWNKLVTERQVLYDFTYVRHWKY